MGDEFRVNTYTSGNHLDADVAADPGGNFIVVWTDYSGQDGSNFGVFGQRFASDGTPPDPEFRINTFTTNFQTAISMAADAGIAAPDVD